MQRQVRNVSKSIPRETESWIIWAARIGHAAKGLVYALVGGLALQAAFGAGGQTGGSSDALRQLVDEPFGQVLLAIIGIGLLCYAAWCFIEAGLDPDRKGSDMKGLATRAGKAISGLIYGGLAVTAFGLVMGSGSSGDSTQSLTARLMSQPFGRWLVGLVGLAVIGYGLMQLYSGATAKFRRKLQLNELDHDQEKWVIRSGQAGLIARGIVLTMVGVFFIQAALQADPSEAQGLGGALNELSQQPFGPWLLAIVAAGLVVYGIYMALLARFRRFPAGT